MDPIRGNPTGKEVEKGYEERSKIEPFPSYKVKIEQLLRSISFGDYSIKIIQHGDTGMNYVYRLEPRDGKASGQRYILRVPRHPVLDDQGVCQTTVNDVALLEDLSSRLGPLEITVPRVKAYSAKEDNALKAPFMIQTQIAGRSLKDEYAGLSLEEKLSIVDQFVDLLVKLESIVFTSAGTFVPSSGLPLKSNNLTTAHQTIRSKVLRFSEGDEDSADPGNLKALLSNLINGWTRKDPREDPDLHATMPFFKGMPGMLDKLDQEGVFVDAHDPIVLHHTDLEPRNIMVNKSGPGDKWIISGIVDWDGAVAVPRPLARMPPAWIWDSDATRPIPYFNSDYYPISDENLSENGKKLKTDFAAMVMARKQLGQKYLEDAYGPARWLRLIWHLVRGGIPNEELLRRMKKMEEDWDKRMKQLPSTTSTNAPTGR